MGRRKKIVIKVGTKVITSRDRSLDKDHLKNMVNQVADVQDGGARAIVVTSGAIGAGMWLLGMKKRPTGSISELQAAASVGQGHLMHLYSEYFRVRGYTVGQVLLTQEDFNDRRRYLNIRHTINALLERSVIPVINENDTVATDEIRCGDNDRLSAMVADLCGADTLVILSDVEGLIGSDGKVVRFVESITPELFRLAGRSESDLGTGGMATKLEAASIASGAGIECVIAGGREKGILTKVLGGEAAGTRFTAGKDRFLARKRWIAYTSRPKGAINVDDGAKHAIIKMDRSLLASGITGVSGHFSSGDVVRIIDSRGCEFARGVAGFSSAELSKIKGKRTAEFRSILGYLACEEAVHKDNLAVL